MTAENLHHYKIQLVDEAGEIIQASGGVVKVCTAGTAAKATLKNSDGSAKTNDFAPTRGNIDFYVANTVETVDLYIHAPGGQFVIKRGVKPSGPSEIVVDTSRLQHVMVIPFDHADQAGDATETGSGFTEPTNAVFMPQVFVDVLDIDATETIDVGTDSGDSGDADGMIDGLSLATAGVVKATNANGSVTLGDDFYVQDSANAGDDFPEVRVSTAKEITWTLSAGTDTGSGFVHLPYILVGGAT